MSFDKRSRRQRIRNRISKKIKGTTERPRLSVFRSNKNIYCQLIDDSKGKTLASVSSQGVKGNTATEIAVEVGKMVAKKAKSIKVEKIVFDRSGYLYHGRVKAIGESAREGGLKF